MFLLVVFFLVAESALHEEGIGRRTRTLSSRTFYTLPHYMNRFDASGFVDDLDLTKPNCERLFDLYSYLLFGTCQHSDDIVDYILKAIGLERTDAIQKWNSAMQPKGMSCYGLLKTMVENLPIQIAEKKLTFLDSNDKKEYHFFKSELFFSFLQWIIFLDVNEMLLYRFANGLTDEEIENLSPFNDVPNPPDFRCTAPQEEEYCGEEEESELLRLTRETHAMMSRMSDGVSETVQKQYLERKLNEFRQQHSYLNDLDSEQIRDIMKTQLITADILEHLLSNVHLSYIDVHVDKDNKKLTFFCHACAKNGLTNIKNQRSVEWEISQTASTNIKHTLDNLRHHYETHHHQDSVRVIESEAEKQWLAEFSAQNPNRAPNSILLTTAYYCAKLAITAYCFSSICQLLRDVGIDIGYFGLLWIQLQSLWIHKNP